MQFYFPSREETTRLKIRIWKLLHGLFSLQCQMKDLLIGNQSHLQMPSSGLGIGNAYFCRMQLYFL